MSRLGIIPMQAIVGGMSVAGDRGAVAMYAGLDVGTGVLLVREVKRLAAGHVEPRRPGYAVVSNIDAGDFDVVFAESDLKDAIRDYFAFAGRGLLIIEEAAAAQNPASKIEPDGVDEAGRKFRVANDISDGQIAVIALCWFAVRQSGFAQQLEHLEDFIDPRIMSVGLPDDVPDMVADRAIVRYEMGGKLPIGADGWPI